MKRSIRTKMLMFSGFAVALVLLLAFVAFFITWRTRPIIEDLLGKRVIELVNVGSVNTLILQAENWVEDTVREGDPSVTDQLDEMKAEVDDLVDELLTITIDDPEVTTLYNQLATDTPTVFALMDTLLEAATVDPQASDTEEAEEAMEEYLQNEYEPLLAQITTIRQQEVDNLKEEINAIIARLTTLRIMLVVVTLAALVAGGIVDRLLTRPIIVAAAHLASAAESISRGDLDAEINVKTGDELESLAESLERMRASLKAAIERLRTRRE